MHEEVEGASLQVCPDDPSFPTSVHSLGYQLSPSPHLENNVRSVHSLCSTLVSWVECGNGEQDDALIPDRYFYLEPRRRHYFRRDEFIQLLRIIGPAIEAVLFKETLGNLSDDAGEQAEPWVDPCLATISLRNLGDRFEWEGWWRARIRECFPIFTAHQGRLLISSSDARKSCLPDD